MQRASLNLKAAVVRRVALGAFICACTSMFMMLWTIEREARHELEAKALAVQSTLQLQLVRIENGFDKRSHFPDWELVDDVASEPGLCIHYLSTSRSVLSTNCKGTVSAAVSPPWWFKRLYMRIFASESSVEAKLTNKDGPAGLVTLTSAPATVAMRGWRAMVDIMWWSVIPVLLLCGLVYLVIDHAFRPTATILSGLDRLATGDFSHRLPEFALIELQHIGEHINRMAAELERSASERTILARQLIVAQEDERRYLARELHDELGQRLAALNAVAASIEVTAERTCPTLLGEAQSLSTIASELMTDLRGALARLRPTIIKEVGLISSLESLVASWNVRLAGRTRLRLESDGNFTQLSEAVAANLYRIAQEGLTNAAKHADAQTVVVKLQRSAQNNANEGNGVSLTIADDGRGCEPKKSMITGSGLLGIRERVTLLGGSFELQSRVLKGTRLSVSVPELLTQGSQCPAK